jgi:putative nucleotidyltransferase with HDIG domain
MIAVSMVVITILVYVSGGARGIAIHFYYLPIIWAGYVGGDMGAILAVLAAALLCGPYMPADTQALIPGERYQTLQEVLLKVLFFFVVGIASSRIGFTLRRRATEFETLYDVARTVSSSLRLESVLNLIVESAAKVMNVKACSLRLLDSESQQLNLRASRGLSPQYLAKGPVQVEESPIDARVLKGEPVTLTNVTRSPGFQYAEEAAKEGLTSVLTVPLLSKGEPLGVIRVYAHSERQFTPGEVALLEAFANQASVAIENASLYEDIRRNYYETVRALTIAIEARDPATYGHSERVTEIVQRLADRLGMTEERKEYLRFGTILHDIGKIGVEHSALDARRSEQLELRMFYEMHPIIGRSIIAPIEFLQPVCSVVLYHHERWDGSGFPEGLAGDDIPYEARLVAVVDAYDRMVHGQGGGEGMHPAEAFVAISNAAGQKFDPEIVDVFMKLRAEEIARFAVEERSTQQPEASDV